MQKIQALGLLENETSTLSFQQAIKKFQTSINTFADGIVKQDEIRILDKKLLDLNEFLATEISRLNTSNMQLSLDLIDLNENLMNTKNLASVTEKRLKVEKQDLAEQIKKISQEKHKEQSTSQALTAENEKIKLELAALNSELAAKSKIISELELKLIETSRAEAIAVPNEPTDANKAEPLSAQKIEHLWDSYSKAWRWGDFEEANRLLKELAHGGDKGAARSLVNFINTVNKVWKLI